MKYWRRVNFGDFIGKSPIFNPPIVMYVCHVLLHFIKIANINFANVFLHCISPNNTPANISSYTVYNIAVLYNTLGSMPRCS